MAVFLHTIKEFWARVTAPPRFPDRDRTDAAEKLHAVLLTVYILLALVMTIGVPFVFENKSLAMGMCLLLLGTNAYCWRMMRRGYARRTGLLLTAILWLTVGFITLFSRRGDIIAFLPVIFIGYLLSGPRLAAGIAASAVVVVAAVLFAEPLGLPLPAVLFQRPPQSVLFLAVAFLAAATMPFVLINRQLRQAVQRLERFREVQQDLRAATWIWDVRHEQADWDTDLAPILGLAPGAFSGRFEDYLLCLHPEDAPIAKSRFIDCLKGIQPSYRAEERVIWPDGSVRWLAVKGRAAYGGDRRATRVAGTITDITDRKLGQLALASAEERFRQAFRASPVAMIIVKLPEGRIVDINPTFEQLSGYSSGGTIGKTATELGLWLNPGDRDRWYGELAAQGVVHDFAMPFRAKDGTVLSTRLSSCFIDLGDEKDVLTVVRDVTAQERAERAIRESEEKYAAVFDNGPEAIALSRARDSVMLEVNHAWTQQTGYSRAQGLDHSALELGLWLNGSDRDAVLSRLAADGHVSNFPSKFVRAGGSAMDVLISASRLVLNGEACIAWAWRDISELRQLEQARAESDRRYRTLFDSALDAIAIVSPQGALIDINAFGLRATGYSRDELVGRNIDVVFDPQRLARSPLRPAAVLETGAVRMKRTMRRKDGVEFPAEILAGPLPDGNILAIVRDLTERNRRESLLQNIAHGVSAVVGETFFRSLVVNLARELSADYCFIGEILPHDASRVRTLAFCADNAAAPNFTYALEGSPCANVISRHGSTALPDGAARRFPADRGLQKMAVEGYIGTSLFDAQGAAIGILVVMSRKAISEVALWTSVMEIFAARAAAEMERTRAETRVLELNASLEQRVAERTAALESANRELESFSYSVSHDLRAPLRAIDGFAGILLQECKAKLDEQEFSLLTRISQNAARMTQLIEDLLNFARAGRDTLKLTTIDMRPLVDGVIADLQTDANTRAEIDIGDLPPATGDAAALRQVWQNLIGNALKFSRNAARPRVRIEGAKRGGMIEYGVSDNGAGFDPTYANRLFGVFQRLHTPREFEGTGIGLAIARRIVERHGGRISAEGAVGAGATFRFTLPA